MVMKCITIRDSESGVYFVTRRGKKTWALPGHAKNAWNEATHAYRTGIYFDDQDKVVVEESVVISEALYNDLMDNLFRMKDLEE